MTDQNDMCCGGTRTRKGCEYHDPALQWQHPTQTNDAMADLQRACEAARPTSRFRINQRFRFNKDALWSLVGAQCVLSDPTEEPGADGVTVVRVVLLEATPAWSDGDELWADVAWLDPEQPEQPASQSPEQTNFDRVKALASGGAVRPPWFYRFDSVLRAAIEQCVVKGTIEL